MFEALQFKLHTSRFFYDDLGFLVLGTDAGFYRLSFRLAIKKQIETEVVRNLKLGRELELPFIFRAVAQKVGLESKVYQLARPCVENAVGRSITAAVSLGFVLPP